MERVRVETTTAALTAAEAAAIVLRSPRACRTVLEAWAAEAGHHAGDLAIATAAQRLRSALRTDDFLARHGGDEFVALLFGQADRAALEQLAGRLHAALATPLHVAGTPRSLTASIGIAQVRSADPRDAAQIMRAADAAMYKAKEYRATTHFADNGSQVPEPLSGARTAASRARLAMSWLPAAHSASRSASVAATASRVRHRLTGQSAERVVNGFVNETRRN